MHVRRLLAAGATALALTLLTACGAAQPTSTAEGRLGELGEVGGSDALVIYNAQHESMARAWADAFTAETGIKTVIRNGKDFELANQIKAEGMKSPADVFLTENSPAMALVEDAGLFANVDPATLQQVPQKYSTTTGRWVGIAARSTVFVYNTTKLDRSALPTSLLDLQRPEWQGRWGASAGGADFQAIVSALLAVKGEEVTRQWLAGMKINAKSYQGNNAVLQGVNAGEIDGGVIYHYYWYRDQAKTQENSANTELLFFGNADPGAFVSVSGGGVLAAGKHQAEAQRFLKWLTGPTGQQALADSTEYEYTVGSGVPAHPALKPLSQIDAPAVDPSTLNGPQVVELMTQAGLI